MEGYRMTKRNFTDLTAIDCPFGELDDDTQARLKAWPWGWEYRFLGDDEWVSYKPVWSGDVIYRARRASDAKPECLHPFCGLQCGDAKPEPAGPVITETVKPYLAPFDAKQKLMLEPVQNGGWIVHGNPHDIRVMSQAIGAFGSAADMLSALRDAQIGGAK